LRQGGAPGRGAGSQGGWRWRWRMEMENAGWRMEKISPSSTMEKRTDRPLARNPRESRYARVPRVLPPTRTVATYWIVRLSPSDVRREGQRIAVFGARTLPKLRELFAVNQAIAALAPISGSESEIGRRGRSENEFPQPLGAADERVDAAVPSRFLAVFFARSARRPRDRLVNQKRPARLRGAHYGSPLCARYQHVSLPAIRPETRTDKVREHRRDRRRNRYRVTQNLTAVS
jgi:hypothetical protein